MRQVHLWRVFKFKSHVKGDLPVFAALDLLRTALLVGVSVALARNLLLLARVDTVVVGSVGLLGISLGLWPHADIARRRQV